MVKERIFHGSAQEPDPDIVTRQEALVDALKARRPPVPPREHSTLVLRSEAVSDGQTGPSLVLLESLGRLGDLPEPDGDAEQVAEQGDGKPPTAEDR